MDHDFQNVSRRDLLQIGALSPLGISLTGALQQAHSANARKPINCIFVWLQGGPSHIDMYDLKPRAPAEIRGELSPIPSNVPGVEVGELMPKMAQCADKYSIVRSMHCYSNLHGQSDFNIMSGGRLTRDFSPPGFGSILSWQQHPHGEFQVPPFVQVGRYNDINFGDPGKSGELGRKFDPLIVDEGNTGDFRAKVFDARDGIGPDRLVQRRSLLTKIDRFRVPKDRRITTPSVHDRFREQAFSIIASQEAQRAFNLDREPDSLRDTYGRNKIGEGLLLARRLIEAGVRFVSVRCVVAYAWDHHAEVFLRLRHEVPRYDQGFAALLNDLDDRGLLDSTLVISAGEFGRTPRLNTADLGPGRDHWNRAFSLTIGGGGIKRGEVLGATDKHASDVTERPVSAEDFAATVYKALGMKPAQTYRTRDGRPIQALPHGTPVDELFERNG